MLIDWSALPGQSIRLDATGLPEQFGSLADELSVMRDSPTAALSVTDYATIRCSGEDAAAFLHNQLTSDVSHLAPGRWQHSAWCTAKGRMLANFLLVRPSADLAFDLCIPNELVHAIVKRLRMFVLRSKVQIEDRSADFVVLGLRGTSAGGLLAANMLPLPEEPSETAPCEGGWIARTGDSQFLMCIENRDAIATIGKFTSDAVLVGTNAWKWGEVSAGIPVIRASTQEEFIPQMINFDKLGGVSFHKGCYPGQEVVARTQYLGKVKRHLYRFHAALALAPGQALFASSQPPEGAAVCGTVANVAPSPDGGWDGLAVILEGAASSAIHVGSLDGPTVSNINLVAA